MMNLLEMFGLQFNKNKLNTDAVTEKDKRTFIAPANDDGAHIMNLGSVGQLSTGYALDFEAAIATDKQLVMQYRDASYQPEADSAIENIVCEAIVVEEERETVALVLDETEFSESIKKKMVEEFAEILAMLDFNVEGHDIFRKWYIDGRLYFQKILDKEKKKKGIIEIRPISPLHIKKVREIVKDENKVISQGDSAVSLIDNINEYYIYVDERLTMFGNAIKINKEAITYVHSGLKDANENRILSYLHKALKPINQLRKIEDAVIIYRLSRAPERRVFYIDVGNLPKGKAEQYLEQMMNKYKNKMVYDAVTGDVKDSSDQMSMLEDFWLPRRADGKGTEITTLGGGQTLGEIEDVQYFLKKMYKSLNVPITRLESENGFTLGRASEITRDELMFSKFVNRLRSRFSELFYDLLKTQVILKGIMTEKDWDDNIYNIRFNYMQDSQFAELKDAELWNERLNTLNNIGDHVGTYFSKQWIKENILKQSETEIDDMQKEIDKEVEEEPDVETDEEGNEINISAPEPAGRAIPTDKEPTQEPEQKDKETNEKSS